METLDSRARSTSSPAWGSAEWLKSRTIVINGRVMYPIAGGDRNIDELVARNTEISTRLREMDASSQGRTMEDGEKDEWNKLSEELIRNKEAIDEMEKRREWLDKIGDEEHQREAGAQFGVPSPRAQAGRENIWDLTTVRAHFASPAAATRELQDRAKTAIEGFRFPNRDVQNGMFDQANLRAHLEHLVLNTDNEQGDVARYILQFGSPEYNRAFGKYVSGSPLTTAEQACLGQQRALSVATGSAGGYAVPITLDPTLIPTSNGTVNPLRAVARKETIVGLEYRGLTAGAVVASYAPEGTEAADNAPSLAQPDIFVERAQAFVPYSLEVGMDWNGLQASMAKLIQDGKDVVEATKFTLGAGHVNNEPSGLLTDAINTVSTASNGAFAIADLYTLEEALPPRFRPMGQWFGNRAIYNQVRQFGVSASEALWQPLMNPNGGPLSFGLANRPFGGGGNMGLSLLGYPSNEVSDMVSGLTHLNSILAIGDPNYYLIVDRIGMTIEVIPQLFGTHGRPTGQRGLYAYWRNTGTLLDPNAFRVMQT